MTKAAIRELNESSESEERNPLDSQDSRTSDFAVYGLLHKQCNRATLRVIARSVFCDEAISQSVERNDGIASSPQNGSSQ
jgi:hypothetical protein